MSTTTNWNAEQYALFLDERTRPAHELLRRVNLAQVTNAVDLGCGPGNSTSLLAGRWPKATIVGVDNSNEMLVAARKDYPAITFVKQDLAAWKPDAPVDLIFSNAVFQWVPDHKTILPALTQHLVPGGFIALQMPHNHEKGTHRSMREVAGEHKWSVDLSAVRHEPPVLSAQLYYDILEPSCREIDIWETEYFHVLESIDAVVEWLKGTGLRPFLKPLAQEEQQEFLRLYAEKLKVCLPQQVDGKILLPFPRLFVVASKR